MPDDELRIDGDIDAEEVGRALAEEGIAIRELRRSEGDREAFFVGLMGGHDGPASE